MFHPMRVLCLLACVAGWSIPAAAQPVYRCGDSYGSEPCPGGKQLDPADPRTAGQRAQSAAAARRDGRLAAEMEQARLADEAKAMRAGASAAARAMPPTPAPAEGRDRTISPAKAKKPAYFTAMSPRKAAARTKVKAAKKAKARKKAA